MEGEVFDQIHCLLHDTVSVIAEPPPAAKIESLKAGVINAGWQVQGTAYCVFCNLQASDEMCHHTEIVDGRGESYLASSKSRYTTRSGAQQWHQDEY
jgi:hypothetical protein